MIAFVTVAEVDLVVCLEGLEHVADADGLMRNAVNALGTSMFVVSSPNACSEG